MMLKMTKRTLICALLPLISAPAWSAGYEFSRFNYTNLYSQDDKVTLAYTWFTYDVEGEGPNGQSTGNIVDDLNYVQGGINYHFTDKFSGNIQYYRGYNVDTHHDEGIYEGSGAFLRTRVLALTGLYRFTPNFSAFLGPTINQTKIKVDFDSALTGNNGNIHGDFGEDYGYGYTVGASYQIPEIALRATLGYQSDVKYSFDDVKESGSLTQALNGGQDTVSSRTDITLPQSLTFDFQTGIAPKTLLMLNVHWRNWKEHEIKTKVTNQLYNKPFVTFANNTIDYSLGLAYQFTPKFVMFAEGAYGEGAGESGVVNPLAPNNGTTSAKLGGRYDIENWSLFMVGRYIWIKDGTALPAAGSGEFNDNTVLSLSAGIEYKF